MINKIINFLKSKFKKQEEREVFNLRVGDRVHLRCGMISTISVVNKDEWLGATYYGKSDTNVAMKWNIHGDYISLSDKEHRLVSVDHHPFDIVRIDSRNRLKLNRALSEFNQPLQAYVQLPDGQSPICTKCSRNSA